MCTFSIPALTASALLNFQCCATSVTCTSTCYTSSANQPRIWDATNSVALSNTVSVLQPIGTAVSCGSGNILTTTIWAFGVSTVGFNPFGNGFIGGTDPSLVYTSPWSIEIRDGGIDSGESYTANCQLYYFDSVPIL